MPGPNFNAPVTIKDSSGNDRIRLERSGNIALKDAALEAALGFVTSDARLTLGAPGGGKAGTIRVRDGAGKIAFNVWGSNASLSVGTKGNKGTLIVQDGAGRHVLHFESENAVLYVGRQGNEGDIIVRDGAGNNRIHLDGATGEVRLQSADCAEEFDVLGSEGAEPGTVMTIEEGSVLRPCVNPYDKRVAGVISGAGGTSPGIVLDKRETDQNRLPIALTGKVHCKVDAQYAQIEVGDLLTTSDTDGHAMKADDPARAFGAVLGKALAPLEQGRGLIPILVSLQ